jgi:hypothetical protein
MTIRHCITKERDRHGIKVLCQYYDPEPGGRDCCPVCGGSGVMTDPQTGETIPCPAGQDIWTLIGRIRKEGRQ